MRINTDKTQVMLLSKRNEQLNIIINGENMTQFNNFKYLNSVLNTEGNMKS